MVKHDEKLNIARFSNPAETMAAAGEALGKILLRFKKTPVLLLLSAGSAIKILNFIEEEALGENLTVTVLDERFSMDPLVNNFAQLQETDFYITALGCDASFIGTLPRTGDTKEILAKRFETALKNWQAENPAGKIIATFGMGSDGHTAGIMPFPKDQETFKKLFDSAQLVTAYDAGSKNPFRERVTTTLPFLRIINEGIGFIVGKEKKPALDRLLIKHDTTEQLPAMIFWEIKNLQIFTDIKQD